MLNRINKFGQALLEYSMILVAIITAIAGMQLYIQRGLAGRYKESSDYALKEMIAALGPNAPQTASLQYEPYYRQSEMTTESDSRITGNYFPGGRSAEEQRQWTSTTGVRIEHPFSDGMER